MPRPRVSELSQKPQAPRLRTWSSTSASNHPTRLITIDRSSKLGGFERRSPRSGGARSDLLRQKNLGGRISDLESQLGHAQEELRLLKEQLVNDEAVKKQAQHELLQNNNKSKKTNHQACVEGSASEADTVDRDEIHGDVLKEADVFEVPVEKIEVVVEEEEEEEEEAGAKEDEIKMLKAKLYDMEKEHDSLGKENESLKNQLSDSASELSNVQSNEDEMANCITGLVIEYYVNFAFLFRELQQYDISVTKS